MATSTEYSGFTAIVTGGASGIGKAIATFLWDAGASVLLADLNYKLGNEVAAEANEKYGKGSAYYHYVDVTSWASTEALFDYARASFPDGIVDYVFANAGAVKPGFPDIVGEPDLRVVDVNIKGTLLTIQGAVDIMRERGLPYKAKGGESEELKAFRSKFKGKIAVTISVTGLYATPCHVIYSTTKWACNGMVRSLGPRLARDNITVNGVAPNLVETAMSPGDMYKTAREENVITPVQTVIDGFKLVLGQSDLTGEVIEASFETASVSVPAPFRDERSARSFDVLYQAYGVCERTRLPGLQKEALEKYGPKKSAA